MNNEKKMKENLDENRARAKRSRQIVISDKTISTTGAPSPGQLLKSEGATAQMTKISEEALRQSWLNLISSLGLTFIYIIIHFIGHYLGGPLSRFFCKPGSEGAFGLMPKKIPASADKTTETGGEFAEGVVFLSISLLLLIIILLIVGMIAVILQVLNII